VEKCTFCYGRVQNGEAPMCTVHCPGQCRVFGDVDDSAWQISGDVAGKKWKIYIDLKTINSSYAINQSPRRKYEGEITTKDDLKSIIQLFDIPVEIV